ncbi:MAG: hypothetical protein OXG04_28635 [Acidobacteria bacterium]|nr:hypothetical protein [Acidobacteriota bacterium]
MNDQPRSPDCPVCSPLAVAGRRCTDMRRFLDGGAGYWRFLWREHVNEIRGTGN